LQPDRRKRADRRGAPTSPFSAASLKGSRELFRRREDRQKYFYVDRYGIRSSFALVAILVLSVADAALTLKLIAVGAAREFNPVMDYFLRMGTQQFLLVKYALTGFCVLAALGLKNYRIWGGRVQVKALLSATMLGYTLLILYELTLLYMSVG